MRGLKETSKNKLSLQKSAKQKLWVTGPSKSYIASLPKIFSSCNKNEVNEINTQPFVNNLENLENDFFSQFLKLKSKKTVDTKHIEEFKHFLTMQEVKEKDCISDLTLANIYMHLKNYELAHKHIELYKQKNDIVISLTGRTAKVKYFNNIENDFLVLEISDNSTKHASDDKSTTKKLFKTDKLHFVDFYVKPLSLKIQEILLTELEYVLHTEYNEIYRAEKIKAYIDILQYDRNDKHILFTRLINYYNSFVDTKQYYHIDQDLQYKNNIDFVYQYNLPVKFVFEVKERLAHVFYKQFRYESALGVYKELGDTENIIRCYIGLNKENEAITETKDRIQDCLNKLRIKGIQYSHEFRSKAGQQESVSNTGAYDDTDKVQVGNTKNHSKQPSAFAKHTFQSEHEAIDDTMSLFGLQYKLYESYLLLASLENEPDYYDKAFEVIQHSEPLRLKGLFYYNIQKYDFSAKCLSAALSINRTESILFSYGCALIENKDYDLAITIFLEFLLYDDKNTKALLNLVNCYFETKQYEKGLDTLQVAIKYTQRKELVDLYVSVCKKHKLTQKLQKFELQDYYNNEGEQKTE